MGLHDLGSGNGFLDMTPKIRAAKKPRINWTPSQLKARVIQSTVSSERKGSPWPGRKRQEIAYLTIRALTAPPQNDSATIKQWGRISGVTPPRNTHRSQMPVHMGSPGGCRSESRWIPRPLGWCGRKTDGHGVASVGWGPQPYCTAAEPSGGS